MTISLPADLEKYIAEQIRTGRFTDPQSVVVVEALTSMRDERISDHDAEVDRLESGLDKEWLRKEIAIGIDEADRGLLAPWDPEEIKTEGRRLLAERSKKNQG